MDHEKETEVPGRGFRRASRGEIGEVLYPRNYARAGHVRSRSPIPNTNTATSFLSHQKSPVAALREPAPFASKSSISTVQSEESLYEHLVRHERDGAGMQSSHEIEIDGISIQSEEDRKLPAVPRQPIQERQRPPITLPYSKNYAATSISKKIVMEESESLYPKPHSIDSHVQKSMFGSFSNSSQNVHVPSDFKATQNSQASRKVAPPFRTERDLARERAEDLMRQSSFYKAALEAADEKPSASSLEHDISNDELLARELFKQMAGPPPPSALDEELARALQAAQDIEPSKPPQDSEEDVMLALRLMEQEESESVAKHMYSDADQQLAMSLSKSLYVGTTNMHDEMLARQLSSLEGTMPEGASSSLIPEQLQILERIQQDKERELIRLALQESYLHDLPMFSEEGHALGVGLSHQSDHTGVSNNEDFRLSQELAMSDWARAERGGRRRTDHAQPWTSTHPPVDGLNRSQSLGRRPEVNPIPGRAVSADVIGQESSINPASRNFVPPSRAFPPSSSAVPDNRGSVPAQDLHRSRLSNAPPRSGGQEERYTRSTTPGAEYRPVALHETHRPRTNNDMSQPLNTERRGSRSGIPVPEYRTSSSQQDLHRSRLTEDLLLRGNRETRNAIASGQSHVVMCQGCSNRLHVHMNYALVYCPSCNTISPGHAAGSNHEPRGGQPPRNGDTNMSRYST